MNEHFNEKASGALPSLKSLSSEFMLADLSGRGALSGAESALSASIDKAVPSVSKKPDFNM